VTTLQASQHTIHFKRFKFEGKVYGTPVGWWCSESVRFVPALTGKSSFNEMGTPAI